MTREVGTEAHPVGEKRGSGSEAGTISKRFTPPAQYPKSFRTSVPALLLGRAPLVAQGHGAGAGSRKQQVAGLNWLILPPGVQG